MVIVHPGSKTMSETSTDFSGREWQLVHELLQHRYGARVELDPIEVDVAAGAGADGEPASCPGLHWCERGAHFVVVRTGDAAWRGQYFYDDDTLRGPGDRLFDDLGDCVTTLLRLQADDERQRAAGQTTRGVA